MLFEVKFVMGSFHHNLPHAHCLFFQLMQTLVGIQLFCYLLGYPRKAQPTEVLPTLL